METNNVCRRNAALDIARGIGRYSMDVYVSHMFLVKFFPIDRIVAGKVFEVQYIIMVICAALIVGAIWQIAHRLLDRFRIYRLLVGRT